MPAVTFAWISSCMSADISPGINIDSDSNTVGAVVASGTLMTEGGGAPKNVSR